MSRALLFDLDDTLMVEEPAAVASFDAAARVGAARYEIDSATLAVKARSRARELWYAGPTHDYCMRVGISSWEGLWCRFEGDGREVRALRDWSPAYRQEAWRLALADQGVDDLRLAEELAERFGVERRARHEVFADVAAALGQLKESHSLAREARRLRLGRLFRGRCRICRPRCRQAGCRRLRACLVAARR
jgi:putative hydrolase of the HAD superfamily